MVNAICPACGFEPTAKVRSYVIELKHTAKSLNGVGVNNKTNRGYRKERNDCDKKVRSFLAQHDIPIASSRRRVLFYRFYGKGKRAYDYGNLVGGFKPLLDVIVRNKLLVDDNPKFCSDYYFQAKSATGVDYVQVIIDEFI